MTRKRPWTEAEKHIVRTTYPIRGASGTQTALKAAGFARTLTAIKYRAHILGSTRGKGDWTERELTILHTHYKTGGVTGVQTALARAGYHRTCEAIRTRASLASTRRQPTAWTQRELEILAAKYPRGATAAVKTALAARGFHRTAEAIITRARMLGIKYEPPPRKPPTRHRTIAGQRLSTNQLALIAATPDPDDGLLDPDERPLGLKPQSVRQIARTLTKRRLLHHYSRGLYHLTLGGLAVKRTLEAKRAA